MAFPESYYRDPSKGAVSALEWEQERLRRKRERKAYRKQTGCGGCYHGEEVIEGAYLCKIGETAHSGGFCGKWHDNRTGRGPDE